MKPEQTAKTAIIKTLAIIGLVGTILLSVWLLVQGARVIPGAFSSLASIAEGLQSYRGAEELEVFTGKSILNSEEEFEITWNEVGSLGDYNFSYECTEGVSATMRSADDETVVIQCTDVLSLPSNVLGLTLSFSSEKSRFTDVPFRVTFTDEDGELVEESENKITLVNATIPQRNTLTEAEEAEGTKTPTEVETEVETPGEVVETTVPTAPTVPTQTETVVSYIPQSDPNGFTDLSVSYRGIGRLTGSTFEPRGTFTQDDRGAIRFDVKNIGTKTSGEWAFSAELPSGFVFESGTQSPLKPNERAEFTLGFTVDGTPRVASIAIDVDANSDIAQSNNAFEWSVRIVN